MNKLMKQLCVITAGCAVSFSTLAADLIFKEDFESTVSNVRLENGAKVVTNAPASGKKAVRVNMMNDVSDPWVTGRNGSTIVTTNQGIVSKNPKVLYIKYKFRFDDALWRNSSNAGYSWGDGTANDIAVHLKGGYYGLFNNIVEKGFYIVWRGGKNGELVFADNSNGKQPWNSNWNTESWATGSKAIYLSTGKPFGADGKWHTFEMEVDYTNSQYVKAKIWIDGTVAKHTKYAPDADKNYFRLPKGFKIEQFSTSYATPKDIAGSQDRSGYAAGIQFDDIEVWNGNPGGGSVSQPSQPAAPAAPMPPANLRVVNR